MGAPVASTNRAPEPAQTAWQAAGLRYFAYNLHLRRQFGERIHKVSVDAGFTCPNVDGTVATGGCVFCDNRSFSPSRRLPRTAIAGQIDEGIRRIQLRYRAQKFLAYFQPATNTYAPLDRLRPLYRQALDHPLIVGLAIGTRPDCVPDATLDLLSELAEESYVSLELGLQSIHDRSLVWMNRGHGYADFVDAMARCRDRKFETCVHIILGIPGETRADMLATATALADLNVGAVKLHNLYVVRDTPLAVQYAAGGLRLLEREEYVQTLVDFLELLPPTCVVERISGDAPPDYFVAPAWCLDKPATKAAIDAEFTRRDTWQGKRWQAASGA